MKRVTIIVIFIISFLYALPAYNKFWFPFDEGITLVSADMINHGAIPYKDFITIYGPTQLYALAFLFRIFGPSTELAHLYVIAMHAIITTVIFYLAFRLSNNKRIALFVWLVGLSCFATRMGASASPMWPFMVSAVLSMLFFAWFLEKKAPSDIIVAAVFASIGFLGRFEMGLYLITCEVFIIVVYGLFRHLLPYILSVSVLPAVLLLYLISEGALGSLWQCLKIPYETTIRFAQTNFPPPCLNPIQIFYGSLWFIQVNQHYIPVLAYLIVAVCLVYYGFKRSIDRTKAATLLFITLVGTAIFPYAYFGADVTHTMPVIFPALMLSGYILAEGMKAGTGSRAFKIFIRTSAILLAFLLVLLFIKNSDKYLKNAFVKPFKKDIVYMATPRGNSYVPKDEVRKFKDAMDFLNKNSIPGEKIFIGFDTHNDVFQGGEPMLYFISGHLPASKHFIMLPGTVNTEKVQREIIESLKDVRLIMLTSEGKIISEAGKNEEGSTVLDEYIRKNYKFYMKAGKYDIYIRAEYGE